MSRQVFVMATLGRFAAAIGDDHTKTRNERHVVFFVMSCFRGCAELLRGVVAGAVLISTIAGSPVHAIGAGPAQSDKTKQARSVWDGVYTEEQATRGQAQYMRACASCHAADLRGGSTAPSLVEESFSFQWADTTVGELLERIRTLMPSDRPNSLSTQTYRDVVAFILQANKFPPGEKELDTDLDALRQIAITAKR